MKFIRTPLGLATITVSVASLGAGLTFALTSSDSKPTTKVLGEKIVGSGTSSPSNTSTGPTAPAVSGGKPSPGPTSKPSPGPNPKPSPGPTRQPGPAKVFTISGSIDGLYPGAKVNLVLSVSNALNQDMTVESLSAKLSSITNPDGSPDPGCSPNISVGDWTDGSPFLLPKSTPSMPAPGYIPVTLASDAPPACEGATFNLTFSGTGAQA